MIHIFVFTVADTYVVVLYFAPSNKQLSQNQNTKVRRPALKGEEEEAVRGS